MMPQLNSISVTDFRTLKGTITVPLDAPVVLIHGPNGAGKTSVLAALELVLTGEVLDMRRTDPGYQAHLRNRDAEYGKVVLTGTGVGAEEPIHEITLTNGAISGTPALIGDMSRFFSERCYLAQATLGRLLEIYQDAKTRQDSPLTRFVKDLLGLDHLDALIEGLHPVGDVRNMRRLVPEYADAEMACEVVERRIEDSQGRLSRLSIEAVELRTSIRAKLSMLAPEVPIEADDELSSAADRVLTQDTDERQLVSLTGHRRELASLRQRVATLSNEESIVDQTSAEAEETASSEALRIWWADAGKVLEAVIDQLRVTFPDLPSVASTDPQTAQRTALSRVEADLDRCTRAIAQDDALAVQTEALDQAVAQGRARIAVVDEQLGEITGDTEALTRALVAILPHVHSEYCPVCGRDYREVSDDSLVQRISSQVARLTEQADRVQGLGRTRVQATSDLTKSERDRDEAVSKRLTQDVRSALKARVSDLSEGRRRLNELAPLAETGASIIRREVQTRRRLSELRGRDRMSLELRAAVGELCLGLGQAPLATAESVGDVIQRLDDYVTGRERALGDRQRVRREALSQHRLLREREGEIRQLTQTISNEAPPQTDEMYLAGGA